MLNLFCCKPIWETSLLVASAVVLLGAAPAAGPDELLRDGNAAFLRRDYDGAVRIYREAEERGTDPGLIAFNKATALYHLKKFDDAESHYRRVLDDDRIPVERRAQALYNLANCLVQLALPKDEKSFPDESQLPTLKRAIICYEMCLESSSKDEALRQDAIHNLELAKLLWSKTRGQSKAKEPPTPNDGPEPEPAKNRPPESPKKEPQTEEKMDPNHRDPNKMDNNPGREKSEPVKIDKKDAGEMRKSDQMPPPGPGQMPVIGSSKQIENYSPDTIREYLRKTEQRLEKERQDTRESLGKQSREQN